MTQGDFYTPPTGGEKVRFENGRTVVPDRPIVAFIEGDGIGPDIWRATKAVLDAAVAATYSDRAIAWMEILAGEKAKAHTGEWLPERTFEALREYRVGIKGPLTTPVGGGFRSLNVTLRQVLDLYACIRPVKHYRGVPSPVVHPQKVDMVLFRENTEDVYSGIEFASETPEAQRLLAFLNDELGKKVRAASGVGIKPVSPFGSKRLVRKALQYAVDQGRESVTLVHKGNIMKFTEGAFKEWGYELARTSSATRRSARTLCGPTTMDSSQRERYSSRIASRMPCFSRCFCARPNTTSSPPRTSTATTFPTRWRPKSAVWAWRPVPMRGMAWPFSRQPTALRRSTPARTR